MVTTDNPAVLIAEAKSLWNEFGYLIDTTTSAGRLAMLAPMLADACERLDAELFDVETQLAEMVGEEEVQK